ncbi:MAG: hypothetical protein HQK54_05940 [Oligoflexales bacterium]|nr:hypothetical protein [Oligoflexales bacterium]
MKHVKNFLMFLSILGIGTFLPAGCATDSSNSQEDAVNAQGEQGNAADQQQGAKNANSASQQSKEQGDSVNSAQDEKFPGGNQGASQQSNGALTEQPANVPEQMKTDEGTSLNTSEPESFVQGVTENSSSGQQDKSKNAGNQTSQAAISSPATDNSVSGTANQAAAKPDKSSESTAGDAKTSGAASQTGGMVKYVINSGTPYYKEKSPSNSSGSYEQGDHPLIWEEGEWARTSDGLYLQKSTLSSGPVGRSKQPVQWR